ncbi:MAG: hypothetical protein A2284_06810 [Deltaproteobacteria bacterium RIFOXYA12_FULL_61_11]|nr:MAG: hypothetical protein A2284_06810 [Deltaproteobacteria bacterium RIFOXYA12_FULL_61_11]
MNQVPNSDNPPRFVLFTGSCMLPTLLPGCLLRLEPIAPAHVRAGAIVVLDHGGDLLCHRVTHRFAFGRHLFFLHKGDAERLARWGLGSHLVGEVAEVLPGEPTSERLTDGPMPAGPLPVSWLATVLCWGPGRKFLLPLLRRFSSHLSYGSSTIWALERPRKQRLRRQRTRR